MKICFQLVSKNNRLKQRAFMADFHILLRIID